MTPTASPGFSGPSNGISPARIAAALPPVGTNPCSRNAPPKMSATSGSKPDITSGVAIGRSSVPSCAAAEAGDRARRRTAAASSGRSANGRFQVSALRNAAVEVLARQRELDVDASRPAAATSLNAVASVISAIGVMPAIGSFEKLPSAYDTAPISRPSM